MFKMVRFHMTIMASMYPMVLGLTENNQSHFESKCLEFAPLKYIANATINAHEFILAGQTILYPSNDPSCNRPNQTVSVDLCRVALNITTSSRSNVLSEVWLPSHWTGRFLATGNGGIDGCTKYEDINYGAKYGFATVGSNNGHNGTGGTSFLNNDEVLQDYVFRALHTSTTIAKTLVQQFYHEPPKRSYYLGCSGGGRQGLKAAELYPNDYDGIVIGAPASNFNNLTSWRASFFNKTGSPDSPNFITPDIWKGLIHEEVLKQCDYNDGVRDGVLENPGECDFHPEALLCGTGNTNTSVCLNSAQVEIVRSVFQPLFGESGELVYPGMQPGSEIAASTGLYNGKLFAYSLDWLRYVIHKNPLWDPSTFAPTDITLAQSLNPFNVQTYPKDLTPFQENNGKMIIYHGLQDQQITSYTTNRLYNHLSESTTAEGLGSFLKYFQISGMNHCNTGPGAWMIGQSDLGDAGWREEGNVLKAVVEWVEHREVPLTIEGTKFVDDVKGGVVERRRRHCAWPSVNRFLGGDGNLMESWVCV